MSRSLPLIVVNRIASAEIIQGAMDDNPATIGLRLASFYFHLLRWKWVPYSRALVRCFGDHRGIGLRDVSFSFVGAWMPSCGPFDRPVTAAVRDISTAIDAEINLVVDQAGLKIVPTLKSHCSLNFFLIGFWGMRVAQPTQLL